MNAVVERFFAGPIAGQAQRLLAVVPDRQREHAHRSFERRGQPPGFDRCEQHLGIGMAAKRGAAAFVLQLAPQLAMIVNLAIEDDGQPAAGRVHGLLPGRRKIDDRQPAKGQAETLGRIGPDAFVVRSAVDQRAGHRPGSGGKLPGRRSGPRR